jgi:hypothetical protein
MIKFYLLFISVLLSSCFAVNKLDYLGNSYAPTQNVDIYVDASAVKKPYTIMGKSYFEIVAFTKLEKMQKAAIKKARQKGANAVLFQDYIVQHGSSIQTISKSDSADMSSLKLRTTAVTPVETTRLEILFLKYN